MCSAIHLILMLPFPNEMKLDGNVICKVVWNGNEANNGITNNTQEEIVVHTHAKKVSSTEIACVCLHASASVRKIESRWRMVTQQSMKRESDFSIDLYIYAFKSYSVIQPHYMFIIGNIPR